MDYQAPVANQSGLYVDRHIVWKITSSFRITAVPADPVKPDTKALRLKHSEAYSLCSGGSGVESNLKIMKQALQAVWKSIGKKENN